MKKDITKYSVKELLKAKTKASFMMRKWSDKIDDINQLIN